MFVLLIYLLFYLCYNAAATTCILVLVFHPEHCYRVTKSRVQLQQITYSAWLLVILTRIFLQLGFVLLRCVVNHKPKASIIAQKREKCGNTGIVSH